MRRLPHLLFLLWLLPAIHVAAAEPEVDMRVLIDVSGSMKKNDPANLRSPALRLLVELLPEKSRAGVWSFGQHINELVPLGSVNDAWKKQGLRASKRIGSREMFTDIEQVLARATADWKKAVPETRRNVILLTDGLVDVGKDAALNVESRRRILEDILPAMREAGAVVHTVALSDNADHELLQALAMATDGGYEYANSAERLNRVFIKLFEKSVPADSLPLEGNQFTVDGGIQDMTLLVFNEPGARETRIIKPGGEAFSRENPPANVRWVHEQGYDLVTVEGPGEGQWTLDAQADPDNRVMVVTNLKLKAGSLPNNLLREDRFQVAVWLEEDGKVIKRQDFLKLVSFNASQELEGKPQEHSMLDDGADADGTAGDGVYSADLGDLNTTGSHLFTLTVEGGSFQRQIRHNVQVHDSPVTVSLEPVSDDPASGFALRVEARAELVKMASMLAEAKISGNESASPAIPKTGDAQWALDIPAAPENRSAQVRVEGRLINGRLFKVEIERLLPAFGAPQEKEAEPAAKIPLPPPVKQEEETDWLSVAIVVGGTNLVLIPLLVFGFIVWKKKRNAVLAAEQAAMDL